MGSEKKYKITVSSAEEAVLVLKKNFEGRAKVLSVRQVEGKGLGRFLRKPKLEVIVSVGEKNPSVVKEEKKVVSQGTPLPTVKEAVAAPKIQKQSGFEISSQSKFQSLLLNSGFDVLLVQEFFSKNDASLEKNSFQKNLNIFFQYLQQVYNQLIHRPITDRVVFLGPAGVGKTLALCKLLAQKVFVEGDHPCVIQLNGDQPKGQEALSVFCDILNVPCLQEGMQIFPEKLPQQNCFFDYEGIDFYNTEEISQLNCKLNQQQISTRILVLNSLYDTQFLDACFEQASRMNATHCVFTHLDETTNVIKLWKYILKGGLTPLFLSYGQNLTSDFSFQIFSYLIEKTLTQFP